MKWRYLVVVLAAAGCTTSYDPFSVSSGSSGSGTSTSIASGSGGASAASTGSSGPAGSGGARQSGGAGPGGGGGQVGGGGARCAIAGFTDDFDDGAIDPEWQVWTVDGPAEVVETGGVLEVTPAANAMAFGGLVSATSFDLTGCSMSVEVDAVYGSKLGSATTFKAYVDEDNWLRIGVAGDKIAFGVRLAANQLESAEIPYDAVVHRFWRLSEADGQALFETSSDGLAWTNQLTAPAPPFVQNVAVNLGCGTHEPDSNPGTARFDRVNLPP